jgi:hypothetical protein
MSMNREGLATAVGYDLDSTLCDTRHRWDLAPTADPGSTWDIYSAARTGDFPLPGPVASARLHYPHHQVHIFSGSSESSRLVTLDWLNLHRVPYDVLRQRKAGDRRANAALKIGYILELRELGIEMTLFYEDHPDVAAAIEAETGVPVLVVNPCYPEDLQEWRAQPVNSVAGGL